MERYRTVIAYGHFFEDFLKRQSPKVREKILQMLRIVEVVEMIPQNYLRHLEGTDGLYELRIGFGGDIFRIFCFFDTGRLLVLLDGFQKKTRKTPRKELLRAIGIMREYFLEKKVEK